MRIKEVSPDAGGLGRLGAAARSQSVPVAHIECTVGDLGASEMALLLTATVRCTFLL